MINPQDKSMLTKFTLLAKKIIYDPARAKSLAKIMDADGGITQATLTVLGAVETVKPIPPSIRPMLAVNILIIILDMAEEVMKVEIPQEALMGEINKVLQAAQEGNQPAQQPTQQQPATQPAGLIASTQPQGVPA